MGNVKIVLGDLAENPGKAAIVQAKLMPNIEIVMGLTERDLETVTEDESFRGVEWSNYRIGPLTGENLVDRAKKLGADVVVDLSNGGGFDQVRELALRIEKPFVCGTRNLSNRRIAALKDITKRIPIFYSTEIYYRLDGLEGITQTVLKIAEVMMRMPVKEGKFYTYDELWEMI